MRKKLTASLEKAKKELKENCGCMDFHCCDCQGEDDFQLEDIQIHIEAQPKFFFVAFRKGIADLYFSIEEEEHFLKTAVELFRFIEKL